MNTPIAKWALILTAAGLFSFACANVSSDPDPAGSGGSSASGSQTGSGGAVRASGGAASGGANLGGAPASGGAAAVCEPGDKESCAEHSSSLPNGTAKCTEDGWDLSDCTFCEPEAEVECASLYPNTPDGTLVCDEDGAGWVDEPLDACAACDEDGEATDCESPYNTTNNRGGFASCSDEGGYDWSECTVCDEDLEPPSCAEATDGERPIGLVSCENDAAWNTDACTECDPQDYEAEFDCVDLAEPQHEYTGGTALCGLDSKWDQSTCEYCGDGLVTGPELCDVADPATISCDELGYVNTDETTCSDRCSWSTAVCTNCPGNKCLDDKDCNGSACNGKECEGDCNFNCDSGKSCEQVVCGAGSSCDFACYNSSGACKQAMCKPGATCQFDCYNGGKCENVDCSGATCSFDCKNGGSVCSTLSAVVCADGETCEFNCENGGDCTGIELICQSGSRCQVDCDNNGAKCLTATCENGADCDLSCQNSNCPKVVGFN